MYLRGQVFSKVSVSPPAHVWADSIRPDDFSCRSFDRAFTEDYIVYTISVCDQNFSLENMFTDAFKLWYNIFNLINLVKFMGIQSLIELIAVT